MPLSESDKFSPWNKAFSRRHLIYLSIGFNSSLLFCGESNLFLMASTSTYHPALYPCHAASKLRQVPESIAHKGPEIWLYDRSRGVRRVSYGLFRASAVVAAVPLEVSTPSAPSACRTPVRAIIAIRNQSHAGDGCELNGFPFSDFHTIKGDKKHSGGSHGHPRPHGVRSPTTHGLSSHVTVMQSATVHACLAFPVVPRLSKKILLY
ncbi:hypothetical protein V8E52_000171 [Russula decolorans]|jgi:hypothetical protein